MPISRRKFLVSGTSILGSSLMGCVGISLSQKVFDSHCHIIDPRYPIIENQGYIPPPYTLNDYRQQTVPLGVSSGAIVSGSFHGFDQSYLKATLAILGPQWVGVTQVPNSITDQEVLELTNLRVRALRFNIFRGRVDSVDEILSFANRVHQLSNWHAEIYADAAALAPHVAKLSKLPKIVIDHLGMTEKGLPVLLDLVDAGACVKATGFGRVNMNVPKMLEAVARRSPNALVFGTDLPSTRAKRPFDVSDITLIKDVLGKSLSDLVFWNNPRNLYRLVV
ncbi:MAG: amidohydrolase family protein [Polynucleobacter sp.]|nr:amidohydrolase family protein [Polynucleobacter sp.]